MPFLSAETSTSTQIAMAPATVNPAGPAPATTTSSSSCSRSQEPRSNTVWSADQGLVAECEVEQERTGPWGKRARIYGYARGDA